MKFSLCLFLVYGFINAFGPANAQPPTAETRAFDKLAHYQVVWNTHSNQSRGSMPLGNGDIGLNVWTVENGDLLMYLAKTDAWSENPADTEGLLKLGLLRFHFDDQPFQAGKPFAQILNLQKGRIELKAGDRMLTIWVDANHPVVYVETNCPKATGMRVSFSSLRSPSIIAAKDSFIVSRLHPDYVFPKQTNRIAWLYANQNKTQPALTNLKFGAVVQGNNLVSDSDTSLRAETPQTAFTIAIYPASKQIASTEDWLKTVEKTIAATPSASESLAAHEQWWRQFWQRSWVFVEGDADAEIITRSYILQRFINACAGRGVFPFKYNGSLFTMDDDSVFITRNKIRRRVSVNGDFRTWGGRYWFQNTRHSYWPMIASGDYDLMEPFFRMMKNQIALNRQEVRTMYGVDGLIFAETHQFWGGIPNARNNAPGGYTNHYYTQVLELSAMMLDYYANTQDKKFLTETLLSIADEGLLFFVNRFNRDQTGKLRLYPDNSMETYWRTVNPLPDIAGLHYVLKKLLALPDSLTTPEQRKNWLAYAAILPAIPTGIQANRPVFVAAQDSLGTRHNTENPELCAVFPFRLYGIAKPDSLLAKNTYDVRQARLVACWHHDLLFAALLGLTDEARQELIKITTLRNAKDNRQNHFRFPAFWGPGHDYSPDQDHGGIILNAVQTMLLQENGNDLLLLPAWPRNWNVSFKLHAPQQSVVYANWQNNRWVNKQLVSTGAGSKLRLVPRLN